MKRLILLSAILLVAVFSSLVHAYEYGQEWKFGSCGICGKIYKHTGHDTSGNKVGQKVYFRRSGVVKSIHKDSTGWGYIVVFESDWTSFNIIHLKDVAVEVGKYYQVKDNRGIYVGKISDLSGKNVAPHIHVSQMSTTFNKSTEPWYWAGGLPSCRCGYKGYPQFPWKYVPPDGDLVRIFD